MAFRRSPVRSRSGPFINPGASPPDPYSLSRSALPAFALRATAGRLPPRSAPVAHSLRSFAPCNGRTLTTALDGFTMRLAQHEGLTTRCSGRAYSYRISVRRTLTDFLAYFDELAATRLGGGIQVRARLTWDHEKGLSWSGELPPDDDLAAYLHRLRPFLLQNEATSFDRVCAIIGRALPHEPMRALLRRQRREFDGRNFQSQFQLLSNDVVVNSERVLKLWLNGFEYHRDREQRDEIARLHQLLPMDATRPVFVSMIIDKVRAVAEIATVVRILLRRAERGREVRFDKLSIRHEQAND
jgi:hypothetical protein